MARSADSHEHESPAGHGSDWVRFSRREMERRRLAYEEAKRAACEQENARRSDLRASFQDLLDADSEESALHAQPLQSHAASKDSSSGGMLQAGPAPVALIERLRIKNLRSFAGSHEVTLAPLTLVYGPNSAGKSTLLQALRTFTQVVEGGRSDGLHAWANAMSRSEARGLVTYEEPHPDDPSQTSWRSELSVGVDFRSSSGSLARAEMTFSPNPAEGPVDSHRTALGWLDEPELSVKRFGPADFDPDTVELPEDFGIHAAAEYRVVEERAGEEPVDEVRLFDPLLFAHSNRRLQEDLFVLVLLLRYLGAHRGEPSSGYAPFQGPFRITRSRHGFSGETGGWGIGPFGGYEVLNQVLSQLEVPYEFTPEISFPRGSDGLTPVAPHEAQTDWHLRDSRSGARVGLDAVGYGISQLLPVIDVCAHAREQVICIEEPELHLHPRLQAKLGNLFATAVTGGRNQVIVETHSENILRRVRLLIRRERLRPEDVAILYVDNRDASGAKVRRIRLGDNGDLLDPWPTGFFDDRLRDVLGIIE